MLKIRMESGQWNSSRDWDDNDCGQCGHGECEWYAIIRLWINSSPTSIVFFLLTESLLFWRILGFNNNFVPRSPSGLLPISQKRQRSRRKRRRWRRWATMNAKRGGWDHWFVVSRMAKSVKFNQCYLFTLCLKHTVCLQKKVEIWN